MFINWGFRGLAFEHIDTASLAPEALEAMKNGEDPPMPEAPAEEAPPVEEVIEAAPEAAAIEAPTEDRGDRNKAIASLRGQNAELTRVLTDPVALGEYLAKNGYQLVQKGQGSESAQNPYDAFDGDTAGALQAAIDAAVGPLKQELEVTKAQRKQAEAHNKLLDLERQIPGSMERIQEFDDLMPEHTSAYSPGDKYLLRQAIRAENPAERVAYTQELLGKLSPEERASILSPLVTDEATKLIADKIRPGGTKQAAPVTLSGAPSGKGLDVLPNIDKMTTEEYAKLPPEVRAKYRE